MYNMYAEVNKIRKEYIQYFKDVILNSNVTRKNKVKNGRVTKVKVQITEVEIEEETE